MKLLSAQQVRDWDAYTIMHEPVSSIDLMERAASAFTARLCAMKEEWGEQERVFVFCGPGNNGGDGLAIARMLAERGKALQVFILKAEKYSADLTTNLQRLGKHTPVAYLDEQSTLPAITARDLVIDALFGTGLNKPLTGFAATLVQHINRSGCTVVAVDIPSGLPADLFAADTLQPDFVIRASHTLTFQLPKQSFLQAEASPFTGEVHVLDIGLHPSYLEQMVSHHVYLTREELPGIRQRQLFAHKGQFGHAVCIGGSYGKLGAAVLMSKACLQTGCGLVTAFVPKVGYTILQSAFPEAMVMTDDELYEIRNFPDVSSFTAIGIGPGLGMHEYTAKSFHQWIAAVNKPCVIDADALNICAKLLTEHHDTFRFPRHAVLTPHPKEFDRLAGLSKNSGERLEKQLRFAEKHQVYVVLKGAHTSIATPAGELFFNTTGNPCMATAGSGDVLTGVITSLLAQGYSPEDAALLGVYLHGAAGDHAAENRATILASDIIESVPYTLFSLGQQ